jgi:hypothetical protein
MTQEVFILYTNRVADHRTVSIATMSNRTIGITLFISCLYTITAGCLAARCHFAIRIRVAFPPSNNLARLAAVIVVVVAVVTLFRCRFHIATSRHTRVFAARSATRTREPVFYLTRAAAAII